MWAPPGFWAVDKRKQGCSDRAYRLLGLLDADDPARLVRSAGGYKAWQAAGGAAAWALSLPGSGLPPSAQAYVNVGLAVFAFAIAAAFVLRSPAFAPAPRCASVPSHLAQIM